MFNRVHYIVTLYEAFHTYAYTWIYTWDFQQAHTENTFLKNYLKERIIARQRLRHKESEFPSSVHSPHGCNGHSWTSPKLGTSSESPTWRQGLRCLVIFCFSTHISMELAQKWSRWTWIGASSSSFTYYATEPTPAVNLWDKFCMYVCMCMFLNTIQHSMHSFKSVGFILSINYLKSINTINLPINSRF